jgi:hypothetical protein
VDTILIGKQCSNCTWGAEVGGDLFVTSGTELYRVKRLATGVEFRNDETRSLQSVDLLQTYPNPFQSDIRISFHAKFHSHVSVKILSISGAFQETIFDGFAEEGSNQFTWNSSTLGPGTYHVVVETAQGTCSQKCIKLK